MGATLWDMERDRISVMMTVWSGGGGPNKGDARTMTIQAEDPDDLISQAMEWLGRALDKEDERDAARADADRLAETLRLWKQHGIDDGEMADALKAHDERVHPEPVCGNGHSAMDCDCEMP